MMIGGMFAQAPFEEGDKKATLTVGVGTVPYSDKNRATFDQHLSMEWGVAMIADKLTLGVGVAINNQYGAQYESLVIGSYDYNYVMSNYGQELNSHNRWAPFSNNTSHNRKGIGSAKAKIAREDIDLQGIVSLHYSPLDKLDAFVTFGVGVAYLNYITTDIHDEEGFSEANYHHYTETSKRKSTVSYSYNDLDHVKWEGMRSKAGASVAAYLGATYSLTETWGVTMQIGLIDANVKGAKKGYPNSYGVFALGASYLF